ncbi:E3 ubiquitin-protein ligase [Hordeum vulgare]|nr:E3 ubiquitin-protein ligase [Hordeum vulgare]
MRMPPKRPIGGSGDTRATEALDQGVKMATEVAISAYDVSLDLDAVDGVVLPQPDPEVHTDSSDNTGDDSGNDSDVHSGDDADDDGQPISHLYPSICQIYPTVLIV